MELRFWTVTTYMCVLDLPYLYKQWDGLHVGNAGSVDGVSGHDVQGSCAALHNLLHSHTVLKQTIAHKDAQ